MKRIISATIFFIMSNYIFPTPDQSNWGRFIYIGNNEENYFAYFILRIYPGTYYDYTDSVFVCKFASSSGTLEEKKLISVTIHKDTTTFAHWSHVTNTTGFPTEKYLAENGIWYQFPSTELRDFTFLFEDGDMFLKKQLEVCKISEKDKNLDYLKMVVDNTRWYNIEMFKHYNEFFNEQATVVEYYKNDGYYFFIVCIGSSFIDSNYFQYILPIPVDIVNKALGKIEKKIHK
jgi:hypothetical protein